MVGSRLQVIEDLSADIFIELFQSYSPFLAF